MKKEPWMRTCSECGKAMAQGYVVGGGDEYYCSDECLHKHYSEEEWEEMSEEDEDEGNDFNYWTEWGPGDELDESLSAEEQKELDTVNRANEKRKERSRKIYPIIGEFETLVKEIVQEANPKLKTTYEDFWNGITETENEFVKVSFNVFPVDGTVSYHVYPSYDIIKDVDFEGGDEEEFWNTEDTFKRTFVNADVQFTDVNEAKRAFLKDYERAVPAAMRYRKDLENAIGIKESYNRMNESSNIDERYYDEIAFDLVDRIFDSLSHTPEWEDVDHYYYNSNLIDNWEDYWTQTISKSIKRCVARGELDIESDDWKTIVNNVKNSPVSVQLSKARKELVKIFDKIEGGDELDEPDRIRR